ncbi:AMP-binding protein [Xanthobacter autotrophicus]|uniref:AMP-binding protein n=1 Tax=Xanthobacter TaxID=279 RepID=UPI0024AA11FA|nr:AMP-binding protein [Xanthobacter autotrophicus]MDI4662759.1 AMP-binding protein [Xanthobacter autotrophicus]
MLQRPEQAPEVAILNGPARSLADDAAATVTRNLARRVAASPDALLRSLQPDGGVVEQTVAAAWRRSGRIATALRGAGAGADRHIVLLAEDLLDFIPAFWAGLRLGATVIPFGGVARTAADETLSRLVGSLRDPVFVTDDPASGLDRLIALRPGAPVVRLEEVGDTQAEMAEVGEENEVVCLIPTSGSTGAQKLAMVSRSAMVSRHFPANYAPAWLRDHCLGVFPQEGVSGQRAVFLQFASWTQMSPQLLAARPAAILEAIERFSITSVQMTNSMAARLTESLAGSASAFDLRSLRVVGLGGETVTRPVSARLDALLRRHGAADVLRAGYGTTETSHILAGVDPATAPLDNAGAPILGGCAAGVSLRIVGDGGAPARPGEVGHVEVRAPQTLFSGYWGELEAFRAGLSADGWWKTGDLGVIGPGGFAFRGRAKHVLVIGGRKFALDDFDTHLQSIPGFDGRAVSFVLRRTADATDRLGIAVGIGEDEVRPELRTIDIRRSLVRRFGIAPALVMAVRPREWPLTATGKVDRLALAARAADQGGATLARNPAGGRPDGDIDAVLSALWRDVLDLDTDFDRGANFFACGGDSLRAATLVAGVDAIIEQPFAIEAFFADPRFDTLRALVEQARSGPAPRQAGPPRTQSRGMWRKMASFIETWEGRRVSHDRLMLAWNEAGTRPPLFCVFNSAEEPVGLAAALGADQPLYAFRSAHLVGRSDKAVIRALVQRYVQHVQAMCPTGPVLLLGQCQGAEIALAMARHLVRRGRDLPLLMLVELTGEPLRFPGDVLVLHGRDSVLNPKAATQDPVPLWRDSFASLALEETDGAYGELYTPANIGALASTLSRHIADALARWPRPWASWDEIVQLGLEAAPSPARPGERVHLDVAVRNLDDDMIGTEAAGIVLAGTWLREGGPITPGGAVSTTPLPPMAPGGMATVRMSVSAPAEPGRHEFILGLADAPHQRGGPPGPMLVTLARTSIAVEGGPMLATRLLAMLPRSVSRRLSVPRRRW